MTFPLIQIFTPVGCLIKHDAEVKAVAKKKFGLG